MSRGKPLLLIGDYLLLLLVMRRNSSSPETANKPPQSGKQNWSARYQKPVFSSFSLTWKPCCPSIALNDADFATCRHCPKVSQAKTTWNQTCCVVRGAVVCLECKRWEELMEIILLASIWDQVIFHEHIWHTCPCPWRGRHACVCDRRLCTRACSMNTRLENANSTTHVITFSTMSNVWTHTRTHTHTLTQAPWAKDLAERVDRLV